MSLTIASRSSSSESVRARPAAHPSELSSGRLVAELREAIWSNQLVLHYQPQIELPGGSSIGVEALVRWQHPRLGLLAPGTFLPSAERAGLMPALTTSVLSMAADQAAAWWRGGATPTMAVNIAPSALGPRLLSDVTRVLDAYGVPAEAFRFELTEDLTLDNARRLQPVLVRLRDLGIRISADDFGAGCSSYALLRALPLDEIKIDRSFVQGMTEDRCCRAIVQSLVDLAAALGVQSVAEGVEDAATLALLRELRCDAAQGYLLGRPMTAQQLSWPSSRASA